MLKELNNSIGKKKASIIMSIISDGISINDMSNHLLDRDSLGSVKSNEIINALSNPLFIRLDVIDNQGRVSRRYIAEYTTVNFCSITGVVITNWHTGSSLVKKYGRSE